MGIFQLVILFFRGGFKYVLICTPMLWKMNPFWLSHIFSKRGWLQPPTSYNIAYVNWLSIALLVQIPYKFKGFFPRFSDCLLPRLPPLRRNELRCNHHYSVIMALMAGNLHASAPWAVRAEHHLGGVHGGPVLGDNRYINWYTLDTLEKLRWQWWNIPMCFCCVFLFSEKRIPHDWNDIVVCPLSCWFSEVYMFRKKMLRVQLWTARVPFTCHLVLIHFVTRCYVFFSVVPTKKSILRVGVDCKDSQSAATPDSQDGPWQVWLVVVASLYMATLHGSVSPRNLWLMWLAAHIQPDRSDESDVHKWFEDIQALFRMNDDMKDDIYMTRVWLASSHRAIGGKLAPTVSLQVSGRKTPFFWRKGKVWYFLMFKTRYTV